MTFDTSFSYVNVKNQNWKIRERASKCLFKLSMMPVLAKASAEIARIAADD